MKLSAADIRYGTHTDRYIAKDVYLTGTVKGMVLKIGHKTSLVSLASAVSGAIGRRVDSIFPKDTAPFIKALLVGNKSDIYRDDALYVSLSRAGLMHVVAVSGVQYLILGFYTIARKPVNTALFGHRPLKCTRKLHFT